MADAGATGLGPTTAAATVGTATTVPAVAPPVTAATALPVPSVPASTAPPSPAPLSDENASALANAKEACAAHDGTKVSLYTQVYAQAEYDALSKAWAQSSVKGLTTIMAIQPIENVTATAKALGTRTPYQWSAPTLVYHNDRELPCATALAEIYERNYGPRPALRPLPGRLKKQQGVIELWVPPGGVQVPAKR